MSKGPRKIERRIGELSAATKDRALSIREIAAYAFENGATPSRKQRLSATRATHRLLKRAAEAMDACETSLARVMEETSCEAQQAARRSRLPITHIFCLSASMWRSETRRRPCRAGLSGSGRVDRRNASAARRLARD
jgi:hypothetical protein